MVYGDAAGVILFLGFFVGFAIKVPMFPFHTWLPDAHVEAPTAGSVILAGVLLKMGTYGLIRFSLPFFPSVIKFPVLRGWLIALSLIGIIYGALVSLMQKDMKKLVAYSSVSHLGFCTLGIFALNQAGIAGSVIQQINHGISTGALFLIVGILYERRHTRDIAEYGGISTVMPVYATVTLIMFLSSMGLPLLNGFVGEFTILQGTFMANKAWAAWAVPGVVLGAAYLLWLYQRVFFGPVTNPKNEKLLDLTPRELATFVPLIIIAFCDRPLSEAVVPHPRSAGDGNGGAHQQQRILQRCDSGADCSGRRTEGGGQDCCRRAEECRERSGAYNHGLIGSAREKVALWCFAGCGKTRRSGFS